MSDPNYSWEEIVRHAQGSHVGSAVDAIEMKWYNDNFRRPPDSYAAHVQQQDATTVLGYPRCRYRYCAGQGWYEDCARLLDHTGSHANFHYNPAKSEEQYRKEIKGDYRFMWTSEQGFIADDLGTYGEDEWYRDKES